MIKILDQAGIQPMWSEFGSGLASLLMNTVFYTSGLAHEIHRSGRFRARLAIIYLGISI